MEQAIASTDTGLIALSAAIAIFSAFGISLGLAYLFTNWLSAIARNPSASSKLNLPGFIGFAATELCLLLSFVIAFMLVSKI